MLSVGGMLDISKQVEKVFGVWVCLEKKLLKNLGVRDSALRLPRM